MAITLRLVLNEKSDRGFRGYARMSRMTSLVVISQVRIIRVFRLFRGLLTALCQRAQFAIRVVLYARLSVPSASLWFLLPSNAKSIEPQRRRDRRESGATCGTNEIGNHRLYLSARIREIGGFSCLFPGRRFAADLRGGKSGFAELGSLLESGRAENARD